MPKRASSMSVPIWLSTSFWLDGTGGSRKPVICYLRQSDLSFLPEEMRADLPLINATPGNVYAILREWLVDRRGELQARGSVSRAYVERWHDPVRIARDIKADYERVAKMKRLSSGSPGTEPAEAR